MPFLIVLGSSAVLVLCFLVGRYGRYLYLTSKVPGPSLWEFVFVHAKELVTDNLVYHAAEIAKAYKHRPWGMWSFRGFLVMVSDCESVGEVFKSRSLCSKPTAFYEEAARYMGRGLLSLNGKEHKEHYKMLAPVFRKTAVDTHLHQINILGQSFVEKLRQLANGEDVDTQEMVRDHNSAMAAHFFAEGHLPVAEFVENMGVIEEARVDIVIEVINPVHYLWHRLTPAARARADRVRRALNMRDRAYIEEKPRALARYLSVPAEKRKTTCVLDALMAEYAIRGEDDSFDEEALAAMATTLVASQDTTTFTTNICLVLFALHPEVQRRICEEIDGIFGGSLRPVEHEDLAQLHYLEMAIKEALRIFPAVPLIGRTAEEDVVIGGVTVPKGGNVVINILALHRNPEVFKDPLKYDPDRFSPELSQGRNSYAYLPFSAGLRYCPGQLLAWMALKTLLCYIFREFQVLPGAGVSAIESVGDIKPPMLITLKCPKLPLRFVRRTK